MLTAKVSNMSVYFSGSLDKQPLDFRQSFGVFKLRKFILGYV